MTSDNISNNDCWYITPTTNIKYQEISCLYPSLLQHPLLYTKYVTSFSFFSSGMPIFSWSVLPSLLCCFSYISAKKFVRRSALLFGLRFLLMSRYIILYTAA